MCKAVDINFDIFVKTNHKYLFVEIFHWFLNKVITIAAEDKNQWYIVVASIVVGYEWNISPIDGTNINRIV